MLIASQAAAQTAPDQTASGQSTTGTAPSQAEPSSTAPSQNQQPYPGTPVQSGPGQSGDPADVAGDGTGQQDVVVRGVRGSLLRSINTKRDAGTIVDAISAEELGKFPNRNVAEALANIPGVTVGRDGRGEGRNVTIRGLGEDFALTTLNGRILPTDSAGRAFAFDVLPSEVISGAEVQKAVQSSQLEGSIGGGIDLRTARPFDHRGFHAAGSIEGQYNQFAKKGGFKASGVASTTFANDTMGILISGTYNKYKFRTDNLGEYSATDTFDLATVDGQRTVVAAPDGGGVIVPYFYSVGYVVGERQRWGGSAAYQWKPSDRFEFRLDGLYSNYTDLEQNHRVSVGLTPLDDDGNVRWDLNSVKVDSNKVATNYTVNNATIDVLGTDEPRRSITYQVGGHIDWNPVDPFKVAADVYYGKATNDTGGQNRFVVAGVPGSRAVVATREGGIPDLLLTIPNADGTIGTRTLEQAGNDDLRAHYIGIQGENISDRTQGAKLDLEYEVDNGTLKSLSFGGAYTDRRKQVDAIDNQYTTAQNFGGYPFAFSAIGANVVQPPEVTGILPKLSGDFTRNIPIFDIDTYLSSLSKAENNPNVLNPNTGLPYPTGYATQQIVPDLLASYLIKEKTWNGYFQFNLEGKRWRGDIGGRFVSTKVDSLGYGTTVRSYVVVGVGTANVVLNPIAPITGGGDYTRLLPSANFAYDLADGLKLRLAASQAISRPTFGQLSSAVDYSAAQSNTPVVTDAGNPNLKPVSADQADISLEYIPNNRLAITAAAFYKHLTNFVTTQAVPFVLVPTNQVAGAPTSFQFTEVKYVNGDSAKVYGVEVGGQYFLDNGLGVQANATYNHSTQTLGGASAGSLAGAVPFSANAKIFYEKHGINASVSYQFQSRFEVGPALYINTLRDKQDPYHELAASVAYDILPQLTVYVQGSNLLDSAVKRFATYRNVPSFYEYTGRAFFFGLRARM
ncbi:TonB-dependent receptor [Sphingomonas aerophila]|uniref:TonB-dependent receptor n=1 Tax=Sphingomonas aerophila TaxID=1344948 RepID=A0A7W9BGC6_9SPHN|nr:TonB-dependent receptor [Sphingomonas aerophila]MBB5716627.1 TonB-dependent receptor [Sphingomonas aerophila]